MALHTSFSINTPINKLLDKAIAVTTKTAIQRLENQPEKIDKNIGDKEARIREFSQ